MAAIFIGFGKIGSFEGGDVRFSLSFFFRTGASPRVSRKGANVPVLDVTQGPKGERLGDRAKDRPWPSGQEPPETVSPYYSEESD